LSQPIRPTCVEARLVFSDGTVQRAAGEAALVVDGVLHQQAIDRSESSGWTTTRPHRKVTTLCGCHYDAGLDGEGIADRDVVLTYHLGRQILPPEALGETDGANGPLCDYLIEVEAVPAKEEQP